MTRTRLDMANYAVSSLPEPTPELLQAAGTQEIIPYEVLRQEPPTDWDRPEYYDVWERQERVRWAYAHLGTMTHAAVAVGLTPRTVHRWVEDDFLGFRARFAEAHIWLCHGAESEVTRILREKPHQHDILRIARLNRLDPEHWRRSDPPPPPSSEAQEALRGISALCAAILGARQQPVQGQAQVLPQLQASGEADTSHVEVDSNRDIKTP